jgi:hypothetical protein
MLLKDQVVIILFLTRSHPQVVAVVGLVMILLILEFLVVLEVVGPLVVAPVGGQERVGLVTLQV